MKLSRSNLLKLTRPQIALLGYFEFKDTLMGTDGLFVKSLRDGLFLTLGLEISRYYDSRFTASYYLSKVTRWGATWGDIPDCCYRRVGRFLTKEERKFYLDDEHNKEGVIDSWWNVSQEGMVQNFFKVLEITEPRFVSQENLFLKIENSSSVAELVRHSQSVIALTIGGKVSDQTDFQFIPDRSIDDVPLEWFKAAEIVLLTQNGILNNKTVKLLAADAWRQYRITQNNGQKESGLYGIDL